MVNLKVLIYIFFNLIHLVAILSFQADIDFSKPGKSDDEVVFYQGIFFHFSR